jgi:hypothetical protein
MLFKHDVQIYDGLTLDPPREREVNISLIDALKCSIVNIIFFGVDLATGRGQAGVAENAQGC